MLFKIASILVGLFLLIFWFRRLFGLGSVKPRPSVDKTKQEDEPETLIQDPETGVYKTKSKQDEPDKD